MPDLGGGAIFGRMAIYETFSVCIQMFRNVVVSFTEGYSDVSDDKKDRGYMIFLQPIWGAMFEQGLYSSGGYTRAFTVTQLP